MARSHSAHESVHMAQSERCSLARRMWLSRSYCSCSDSIRGSLQYDATCHARGCQIKSFLAGVLHGKIKTGPISVRARPTTQVCTHERARACTGPDGLLDSV